MGTLTCATLEEGADSPVPNPGGREGCVSGRRRESNPPSSTIAGCEIVSNFLKPATNRVRTDLASLATTTPRQ